MKSYKYYTPEGIKDFLPSECFRKRRLEERIRNLFELNGFLEIETPAIEFYDVFTAGEGFPPQEGLFKFFDQTGRILALRYDGTIPAARIASTLMKDDRAPLKLSYIGRMFRFDEGGGGKQRQFTQAGIEILGSPSSRADAQAIEIAIKTALSLGVEELQVSLGDVNFFMGLVEEAEMSEKEVREMQELLDKKDGPALRNFVLSLGFPDDYYGIIDKMIYGIEGKEDLADIRELIGNATSKAAIDNLLLIYDILEDFGYADYLSFDLGMVQSLDYYTGLIFKGFTYGTGFPIFSGGRYDRLVGSFGKDMPATGFSLGVDLVMSCLKDKDESEESGFGPDVLVGYEERARKAAFAYALEEREKGQKVMMDCSGGDFREIKNLALSKGIPRALYFSDQGLQEIMTEDI